MAKKKIPSLEDALEYFKDVINRASLNDYLHVNGILISKNPKDTSILIKPESDLLNKIIEDPDIKSKIKELDVSNPDESKYNEFIEYIENEDEGWVDINCDDLYTGKVINISVNGFNYDLSINKNSIPLKLRKSEFNNISYRIFTSPKLVLCIKKKFEGCVENSSFIMMRMYQIL